MMKGDKGYQKPKWKKWGLMLSNSALNNQTRDQNRKTSEDWDIVSKWLEDKNATPTGNPAYYIVNGETLGIIEVLQEVGLLKKPFEIVKSTNEKGGNG